MSNHAHAIIEELRAQTEDLTATSILQFVDEWCCKKGIGPWTKRLQIGESILSLCADSPETKKNTTRLALQHFFAEYQVNGVPVAFVELAGDVYPVNAVNPLGWPIFGGLKGPTDLVSIKACVPSAPPQVYVHLKQSKWRMFRRFVQEVQLHGTRLNSLGEFKGTDKWIALIKCQIRLAAYAAVQEDFASSRWHSIHAAELILKALAATKKQTARVNTEPKGLRRDSHNLVRIAETLKKKTGIAVPKKLLDTLPRPTDIRYRIDTSRKAAYDSQMKTMRLISFAYPHLVAVAGYRPGAEPLDGALDARMNAALFVADYPGVSSKECWQPQAHDLYLKPLSKESISQAFGLTPKDDTLNQ